jgi:PTS system nitrogen regulatory IIA component
MENDQMGLEELASYLHRDLREVSKLASRGYLPGRKVGGEWRFARAEINHWIETQMHAYTEQELATLEKARDRSGLEQPLLTSFLTEATMAVPLLANTRASVLKELVNLAEQSWEVFDPEAVLTAIKQREELGSTALDSGVAIPHPRRPLPNALGDHVVAFGKTINGIPFGGADGGLTDLFFLVCCRDDRTHLRVLARLSRILLRPGLIGELRAAEGVGEAYQKLVEAEQELIA